MSLIWKALEYSVLIAFISSCMLCLNKLLQFLSFLVLPLVCFKLEMLFDRSDWTDGRHVFCCAGARARSVAGEHRQGWGPLKDYGHLEMLDWEKIASN